MKRPQLLVLFGTPGAGKSLGGAVLQEKFGFTHLEGDDQITEVEREQVRLGRPWSIETRHPVVERIAEVVRTTMINHDNIVLTYAFVNDVLRRKFKKEFPEAVFVLVTSSRERAHHRLISLRREGHPVPIEQAQRSIEEFEAPSLDHILLENNGSKEDFVNKLCQLIDEGRIR